MTTLSEEGTPVGSREKTVRDRELEARQYKEAAIAALDQLQWCINYLYGIRKAPVARTLANNRETIIEQSGIRS